MSEFARAVQLAPDSARYSYVYAIALHSAGRTREARRAVQALVAADPDDREARALLEQLK